MRTSIFFRAFLLSVSLSGASLPCRAEHPTHVYTARRGDHTCIVTDLGRVKCWGKNEEGQLGLVSEERLVGASPSLPFVPLDKFPHGPIIQLALGDDSTCALADDGWVGCWGDNSRGQLANGTSLRLVGRSKVDLKRELVPALLGTKEGKAVQLTAGSQHYCALFESGNIKCWGSNTFGVLGLGDTRPAIGGDVQELGDALKTVPLGTGVKVLQVSAGESHTCVLTNRHQVKCWGQDVLGDQYAVGVLGPGDRLSVGGKLSEMGDGLQPLQFGLQPGEQITEVEAGGTHTCIVVRSDLAPQGKIKCWGHNSAGQLGTGNRKNRGGPVGDLAKIPYLKLTVAQGDRIRRVSAGVNHTCVLFESGAVQCFGDNTYGQLGSGDIRNWGTETGLPVSRIPPVSIAPGIKTIEISSQGNHTCAVVDFMYGIKCWGNNAFGQLGQPNFFNLGDDADKMGNSLPYVDLGF